MADQGKKGFGNQKGQFGNQWQEGAASYGKPNKGKGKAAAYQWQQPNIVNEWYSEPGTKNGANRTGWQQNQFHQAQHQGQQAQQIAGIAPPNQRDVVGGVHVDAFVRPEMRGAEQQANPLAANPKQGPPAGEASAQRHPDSAYLLWQQQNNPDTQLDRGAKEADAISEHELLDEVAAAHQGQNNPVRGEVVKTRSAPYEREEREQSPARHRSVSRAGAKWS